MKILTISLALLLWVVSMLWAVSSQAAYISLPQDSEGWTVFTPSADSRIVYVSATGSDSTGTVYTISNHPNWGDPTNPGTINAYATYAAAYAQTRAGYPDWILVKRGDTFYEAPGTQVRSGRAADEPFLVGAYGTSGDPPCFKVGASTGISKVNGFNWIAISGIKFYAHTRDPDGGEYTGVTGSGGFLFQNNNGYTGQGVLIEGCEFAFFTGNDVGPFTNTTGTVDGVILRRNIIRNNYSSGSGHCQGQWGTLGTNYLFDGNVYYHNGWYDAAGGSIGPATGFNHNVYMGPTTNYTFTGNISWAPSSGGFKFTANNRTSGLTLTDNLIYDAEVGVSMGINYLTKTIDQTAHGFIAGDYVWDNSGTWELYTSGTQDHYLVTSVYSADRFYIRWYYRFDEPTISGNTVLDTGKTGPTGGGAAWPFWLSGWRGGDVTGNLIDARTVTTSNSQVLYLYGYNEDMNIANNVFYPAINCYTPVKIIEQSQDASTSIVLNGNKFVTTGTQTYWWQTDVSTSGFTPTDSYYYQSSATTENFYLDGVTVSEADWLTTYEPTASFSEPSFADNTRTLATYMAHIGETPVSAAGFLAGVLANNRYNWDDRFTASAANEWLLAGYVEGTTPPTPEPFEWNIQTLEGNPYLLEGAPAVLQPPE